MPNLALIDLLASETNYYVGTNGMEKQLTENYVREGRIAEYCEISAEKMQRKVTIKNLALPFFLAKSIRQAKNHLKRIRPDVVFSKGGYVGLPVVIAAKMLKIPTIIHESDMTLGLANRICIHFASEFLSTYPCHKKAKTVGAIIRESIFDGDKHKGLQTMQFDGKKPILLVMGGSLGAKAINQAIEKSQALSNKFDIFVICGKGKTFDCSFVHQAEFVDNISDVLAATSVCVTRGGSNSLAELTLAQVPFLTVPLTKCSRGEQVKNANWFAKHGCGICVDEDNLQNTLQSAVDALYENRQSFVRKQQHQADLFGTKKVLEIILSYKDTKSKTM